MHQPNRSAELSTLISERLAELRLAWRTAAKSDDVAAMHITGQGQSALTQVARWLASDSKEQLTRMLASPPWFGNDGGADSPSMLLMSLASTLRDLAAGDPGLKEAVDTAVLDIAAGLDSQSRRHMRYLEGRIATDSLTGADSREEILRRLRVEAARSVRYGRPLSVIYIDVDRLKQVNDEQGHDAGDELLATLTKTVQQNTRVTDAFGRLGGDEFLLVLPETDLAGAQFVATKITDLLSNSGIDVTAGAAGSPDTGAEPDALVAAADSVMRAARLLRDQ